MKYFLSFKTINPKIHVERHASISATNQWQAILPTQIHGCHSSRGLPSRTQKWVAKIMSLQSK